jgi:hypothetical protein
LIVTGFEMKAAAEKEHNEVSAIASEVNLGVASQTVGASQAQTFHSNYKTAKFVT